MCPNNCIVESDGPHGETTVIKSNIPNKLLLKSSASPSLLVKIIYDKFEKSLLLYRQEKEYMNVGFDLTRQTMSNWIFKVDELYISHLISHMKKQLNRSHLLLLDEVRVEVINHSKNRLLRLMRICGWQEQGHMNQIQSLFLNINEEETTNMPMKLQKIAMQSSKVMDMRHMINYQILI